MWFVYGWNSTNGNTKIGGGILLEIVRRNNEFSTLSLQVFLKWEKERERVRMDEKWAWSHLCALEPGDLRFWVGLQHALHHQLLTLLPDLRLFGEPGCLPVGDSVNTKIISCFEGWTFWFKLAMYFVNFCLLPLITIQFWLVISGHMKGFSISYK